jgi:hypothetical protein
MELPFAALRQRARMMSRLDGCPARAARGVAFGLVGRRARSFPGRPGGLGLFGEVAADQPLRA